MSADSPEERAEAMARRVWRAVRRLAPGDAAADTVATAVRLGTRARLRRAEIGSPFDVLHGGRTALILIGDLRTNDPLVLAAAAVCETLHPEAAAPSAEVRRVLGPDVQTLRDEVPVPAVAGEDLLDALLGAEPAVRHIAVAERLDHARHQHLRPPDSWAPYLDETRDFYLPIAGLVDALIHRRMQHWCDTFERRFLERAR